METYEQRLRELAEKMAKADAHPSVLAVWNELTDVQKSHDINRFMQAARIALEFGAECYEAGYEDGSDFKDLETGLISHGLKPEN